MILKVFSNPNDSMVQLNSCSSHLQHFSLDKFLYPSIWLCQQKFVCLLEGLIVTQSLGRPRGSIWGSHLHCCARAALCSFSVLNFHLICVAANIYLTNCFSPFPSSRDLEGRMSPRKVQIISLYQPQYSQVQCCSHLSSSSSYQTPSLLKLTLQLSETLVPSQPFPPFLIPERTTAPSSNRACLSICSSITFTQCLVQASVSDVSVCYICRFWRKRKCVCSTAMWAIAPYIRISAAEEWEYSGTPRQTVSNLCLSIIKDEICHAETPHPVTGFSHHSEGPGKVAVMTEITPVRACIEARRVICTLFLSFVSSASRMEEGLCSCVLCCTQAFHLFSFHSAPIPSLLPSPHSLALFLQLSYAPFLTCIFFSILQMHNIDLCILCPLTILFSPFFMLILSPDCIMQHNNSMANLHSYKMLFFCSGLHFLTETAIFDVCVH